MPYTAGQERGMKVASLVPTKITTGQRDPSTWKNGYLFLLDPGPSQVLGLSFSSNSRCNEYIRSPRHQFYCRLETLLPVTVYASELAIGSVNSAVRIQRASMVLLQLMGSERIHPVHTHSRCVPAGVPLRTLSGVRAQMETNLPVG